MVIVALDSPSPSQDADNRAREAFNRIDEISGSFQKVACEYLGLVALYTCDFRKRLLPNDIVLQTH